ncbi:MAG: PTS system mannose/fructose/sorbose family transporter subunit IID [Atopobiaceae bacterium]|jgi:PTS system mannose-specific IID component|nr:PTS system mannose/fructose/sorbose family transporter subunit IID [Atopobiaceae bacterium]
MAEEIKQENPQAADERHLDKKDVTKAWFKWICLSNTNYNYERLMASALLVSFSHVPDKLYPGDKQKRVEFMKRQMEFYNTEPHFGCIINGLSLSMEEEMANSSAVTPEAITAVKTGLMGPFAGIGDTLWQGTLTPILLAVAMPLASEGNLLGPLLYVVLMYAIMLFISHFMFFTGYNQGKEGIEKMMASGSIKRLIATASTMGAIVLGCLANSYVTCTSYLQIPVGTGTIDLQSTLDSILKGGVPLTITLITWWLLKKKNVNSTVVLLILVVIGVVLGASGLFGGSAS